MKPAHAVLALRRRVDALSGAEDVSFVAPEDKLAALASAIGVDRVLSCDARLKLAPDGTSVDVIGTVRARVVQTCIVSLEAFETEITEPVEVEFAPEGETPASEVSLGDADDQEGSSGMADAPDPIVNGVIDLGALIEEHLTMGVDPYPRKPGVVFEAGQTQDDLPSPFAALASLRTNKLSNDE